MIIYNQLTTADNKRAILLIHWKVVQLHWTAKLDGNSEIYIKMRATI